MKIFNFFRRKRKVEKEYLIEDNILYVKTDKSIKQYYLDYMYDVVMELNFPLENIYIHSFNSDGVFLKITRDNHTYVKYGTKTKLNTGVYLFLPELNIELDTITFFDRVDTWFHEIGHLLYEHHDCDKLQYYKEYEACLYAHKQMLRLPIPVKYLENIVLNKYDKNILDIHIQYIVKSSIQYIKSFLDEYQKLLDQKYIGADAYEIVKPEVKEFFNLFK
jgi:hypothetical protein